MLLLILKAGANRYAIDVARIIELVPRVELRTIPYGPPFLAGLLGYRGSVIPVIDLGSLLESESSRDCLSTRIIVINDAPGDQNQGETGAKGTNESCPNSWTGSGGGACVLGLIGEQVSDLTEVKPEQLLPAPVQLARAPFLDAIVQTDAGTIVQLIAVERIRDCSLGPFLLDQGAGLSLPPSNADAGTRALEDSKTAD
jgi:chemotaxis-related protein WspB